MRNAGAGVKDAACFFLWMVVLYNTQSLLVLRVNWSMFLDGSGIQFAVIAGQCIVTGTHRHRCEPFLPVIAVGAEKQNMMKL